MNNRQQEPYQQKFILGNLIFAPIYEGFLSRKIPAIQYYISGVCVTNTVINELHVHFLYMCVHIRQRAHHQRNRLH